jgi:rare lipoprotein A
MERPHDNRLVGLLLLACLAQAACAPYRSERGDQVANDREAVINPERTRAGNPPVYEIFGERYYVQDSSAGYRERGLASWYGKDFHGRSTANGESYDMYGLTAAHKTLPIPTWVEVTHLDNGKRVIVKVNDRGPFVGGRIIDLSYAAAQALGMVNAGTARVEVRALGVPVGGDVVEPERVVESPPEGRRGGFSLISEAAAAVPGPTDRPLRQVYAQVGAFADRDNAVSLVGRLKAGGHDDVFVFTENTGAGQLHRVRIGPLADVSEFDALATRLRAAGIRESHLVVEN